MLSSEQGVSSWFTSVYNLDYYGQYSGNPGFTLLKICYFNILGLGRAADTNQTVLWKWDKLCCGNR